MAAAFMQRQLQQLQHQGVEQRQRQLNPLNPFCNGSEAKKKSKTLKVITVSCLNRIPVMLLGADR